MIKELKCYTVICDNCGKDSNDNSEHVGWTTKRDAEYIAEESNFIKRGNKHYCSDCIDVNGKVIKTK